MKLAYLAYRNMVSKPLNLLLSLLLLSLSVSLVTFVLQMSQQLGGQLNKNIAPFIEMKPDHAIAQLPAG